MKAFIRRADLARDRNDQRPERFQVGNKVDVLVTQVDKSSRRVSVSIKAREIAEEKEAVAQYGSSDSGASLGDILGAALKKAHRWQEEGQERRRCRGRGRRGGVILYAFCSSLKMKTARDHLPRGFCL